MQLCMRVVSAMITDSTEAEANDENSWQGGTEMKSICSTLGLLRNYHQRFAEALTHKYAILYSHAGATFSYRLDDVSRENIM